MGLKKTFILWVKKNLLNIKNIKNAIPPVKSILNKNVAGCYIWSNATGYFSMTEYSVAAELFVTARY